MYTVREVSERAGISIRALRHYDTIGLLSATCTTSAGYRLYDDEALARLQQILLFRELEFPLKEIRAILDSPDFDRNEALDQQIRLLELRKERLSGLIELARSMKEGKTKGSNVKFDAFDTGRIDEYAKTAKARWGDTAAYREFERKSAGRTRKDERAMAEDMMDIFRRFGEIKEADPSGSEARALARELQAFITAHYYRCTDEIFLSLASMYADGGEFTANIDAAGGEGTARFASDAIRAMLESASRGRVQ